MLLGWHEGRRGENEARPGLPRRLRACRRSYTNHRGSAAFMVRYASVRRTDRRGGMPL